MCSVCSGWNRVSSLESRTRSGIRSIVARTSVYFQIMCCSQLPHLIPSSYWHYQTSRKSNDKLIMPLSAEIIRVAVSEKAARIDNIEHANLRARAIQGSRQGRKAWILLRDYPTANCGRMQLRQCTAMWRDTDYTKYQDY